MFFLFFLVHLTSWTETCTACRNGRLSVAFCSSIAWEVFEIVLSLVYQLESNHARPHCEAGYSAYTWEGHSSGISYRALQSPTCWQLTLTHGRLKCLINYQMEESNCKSAFDYDIQKMKWAPVPRGLGKLLPKVTGSIKIGKGSHSRSSTSFDSCGGTRLWLPPPHKPLHNIISQCSQKMMYTSDARRDWNPAAEASPSQPPLLMIDFNDAAKHTL